MIDVVKHDFVKINGLFKYLKNSLIYFRGRNHLKLDLKSSRNNDIISRRGVLIIIFGIRVSCFNVN